MSTGPSQFPLGSPRYLVNRAIIDLCRSPDARNLVAKKAEFFATYPLRTEERSALLGPEWRRLLELGVLPNLVYRFYMLHGLKPETFPAAVAAQPVPADRVVEGAPFLN
jgi:hypothetical protein